jgi:hypothetical protein
VLSFKGFPGGNFTPLGSDLDGKSTFRVAAFLAFGEGVRFFFRAILTLSNFKDADVLR